MEPETDFTQRFRLLRRFVRIEAEEGRLEMPSFDQAIIVFLNELLANKPLDCERIEQLRNDYAQTHQQEPMLQMKHVRPQSQQLAHEMSQFMPADTALIGKLRDTVELSVEVRRNYGNNGRSF